MKKTSLLMKKLAGFSAIVTVVILLSIESNAQCIDNYEPNDSKRESMPILTNQVYHALLTTLDVDWFKFAVTVPEPNIRIILSDQPQNYNVFLHDSSGKIGYSKKKGLDPDTIVANNLTPATYCVKVRGRGGNFDIENCYSLIIETSSTPFRQATSVSDFVSADSPFELYPNPVSNQLFIQCDDGKISSATFAIFNMVGQKISETKVTINENTGMAIDVNSLQAGEYFLEISYMDRVEVKKFVVSK
ncbi:MAG TPA: T9SS type A sorting domain-containing protein [Chitinophagales bacterium]|nr:T9SS type A sorting domain-containing protein [Chitinophagales bacterium]